MTQQFFALNVHLKALHIKNSKISFDSLIDIKVLLQLVFVRGQNIDLVVSYIKNENEVS